MRKICGKVYTDRNGNKGATCANPIPCLSSHIIEDECDHDFRYSHIETPLMGIYTLIPPDKEVVVCRKCGQIVKTIKA